MGRKYDGEFVEFATVAIRDLRRTAYLMGWDWQHAEDLAQEALLKLYDAWPRIRDHEGLMPYARRTLMHAFVDSKRRPWRREVLVDSPTPPAVASGDGRVDDRMLVRDALAALPPRRRACVVLRYYDELSVAETAHVLGCSEGAVKSQTARGLDDLRARLENLGFTGFDFLKGAVA